MAAPPELDLYYMRNRWYEPGTGRFLSEDPKGLAGGSNPLVFAVNNPITNRDPNGLECEFQPVFKLDGDGKETEEVIGEKLVCKDITFGDLHKIQSFLGGDLGRNVANAFYRALLNTPGGITRGVIGGRCGFGPRGMRADDLRDDKPRESFFQCVLKSSAKGYGVGILTHATIGAGIGAAGFATAGGILGVGVGAVPGGVVGAVVGFAGGAVDGALFSGPVFAVGDALFSCGFFGD